MEKYPEIVWPVEFSELKSIENLLKCKICYDYLDTPVITPCSHNYCSLCIRKYLHYKTRCPLCFHELFENQLSPNRILEDILINFVKVRTKLNECMKKFNNNTIDHNKINQNKTSCESQNCNVSKENFDSGTVDTSEEKVDQVHENIDECPNNCDSSTNKSLDSNKPTLDNDEISQKNTNSSEVNDSDELKACPVCRVNIPGVNLNIHIENCSKREAIPHIHTTPIIKRPHLPKLVLNLMKDAELKKKLKEVGLSTKGTRKVLELRYQRYCTLYNAECDKNKPRSTKDLLKQCNDQETLEKTVETLPISMRYKR
ncbi:E3 ubiquitin-protein ligase RAD18-like [Microplitis mediator]|uniref:E3 ubiquitin-protein ligase RAD18-like n=1 Tax=Microplitis mediator TaxID=375433 RepID=UPI0025528617|nr:E3 ubiquitin-protein ligase RAD18-like [Microplitis mediator]